MQLPKLWLTSVYSMHVAWLATANRTRKLEQRKQQKCNLEKLSREATVTACHHFVVKQANIRFLLSSLVDNQYLLIVEC